MKLLDTVLPRRGAARSIAELLGQVWLMEAPAVEALLSELHAARERLSADELRAGMAGDEHGDEVPLEVVDGVARIRIEGPIVKRVPGWARYYGVRMAGAQDVQLQLARALADTNVRSVLLVIDSPGGTLAGVQELADALFAARAQKVLWSYGSDLVASAATWLGVQASRFSANRAALIGSIGVYCVAVDASRFYESAGVKVEVIRAGALKGAGTFGTAITDEQRASWQAMVDGAAALFVEAVARGRGLPVEDVRALATGAIWYADEARGLGLIDRVESLDVAHASCAVAMLEAPDAAPEEPPAPDDSEDDDSEPPESGARSLTTLPSEAAASTPNTDAPTGAEGLTEAMTKPTAGAPATLTPEQMQARIAELERDLALSQQESRLTAANATEARKTQLLEAAISEGRLAPALRGDAEAYAESCGADVARLERWLGTLQGSALRRPAGSSPARPLEAGLGQSGEGASGGTGENRLAARLGVSVGLFDTAAQISHYTADGKVVMRDGSTRKLADFSENKAS